jgi:hypothetical protein|nr:MAG TPA: hypothetical protein [Caudoviricetes sp.]
MINIDKLNVQMVGDAKDIVKELCYGIVTMRFRCMSEAKNYGATEEEIDCEFKMMVLGGVANALSDDVDGYISEEIVAQKLHEIADRAYAYKKEGLN